MSWLDERAGLQGKVAFIMGGGGGLGRAIATDFAQAGVAMALCDRDEALLAETATVARGCGVQVHTEVLNVRESGPLEGFFERAMEVHERLDIVVNVVGGTFRQDFADSSPKGWDALIRTNFTWLLDSIHRALPRVRAGDRGGSIINLTSIEAHRAAPRFAVYAAMKAAVTHLSRTLAVELAPEGIRVNTIAPDRVPTERLLSIGLDERAATAWGDDPGSTLATEIGTPMRRRGTYADVGGCALFLASDLSAYVTGMSFHPDGGVLASSGWSNWPGHGYLNFPPPAVTAALLGDTTRPH